MKINRYFSKKSISRQFVMLIGIFFFIIIVGGTSLLVTLHIQNKYYLNERDQLDKKEKISKEIHNDFNQAFFDARGYLAIGNPTFRDNALAQGPKISNLEKQYERMVSSNSDHVFLNELEQFMTYYFDDQLPSIIEKYEAGNQSAIAKIANEQVTARVTSFQKTMDGYLQELDQSSDNHFQRLSKMQTYTQVIFLLFVVIILLILLTIMVYMFRRLGQPLTQLALAANELADGKETMLTLDTTREDEIGTLSSSFNRMAEKVRDKEQDLLAHNEELIAQQDELQAQQAELEYTLAKLRENENKLRSRNQIINQISNTLNKQDVLDSIVMNMCKIIDADKGLIAMIHDESYASFGVSLSGINQFLTHMKAPLYEQLMVTKEPFSVRRMLELTEKGYHEGKLYCHDLYLPVLSSDEDVIAIMMYTRFSASFQASQMEEFNALTKSIGISLEKIALFEQSEKERKRNQDILNTLNEGVQFIDRNGTTLKINHYLCELFHCNDADLIGLPWEDWTSFMKKTVQEDQFVENLKKLITSLLRNDHEENSFMYTLENPKRLIKVSCEELFHGKIKLGTVLVHRDITKDFEVDQMKSELVSTVSHELRTPLSSILGFTELMLNRELTPDRQKKYLATILNETSRLTALINDFLDVQRMEAGKQDYQKKPVNLLPILTHTIETQQISTSRHRIMLEADSAKPLILGDPAKMEQVFTNLLNNAIKYSPGGGNISVKVSEVNHQVKVAVIDNGLGIPEEAIDKVFTKFYRVDNSDRRRIGGTGLGLSIVQEIVKAHNGEITVQSVYGKGSTFTVLFPAAEVMD